LPSCLIFAISGFDPSEAEKDREASLFAFFGLNTG
jgi:hypothetical protein